jgi:hypothetical protein
MARVNHRVAPALRWEIWERDNFTCHYCGIRRGLTVDHVVPASKGGPSVASNLVTACRICNIRKGNRPYESFRAGRMPLRRITASVLIHVELHRQAQSVAEREGITIREVVHRYACLGSGRHDLMALSVSVPAG